MTRATSTAGNPSAATPRRFPPAIRHDPDPGLLRTLLHALYDAAWVAAALLGSPWLLWMSVRREGFARMVRERLGRGLARVPRPTRPRILVHGVSVGEVKAARSLVTLLAERHPEFEVVLSSTTNTGLEVAQKLYPQHLCVRFPFDLRPIVGHFLRRVDPRLVILVELEVWPNFLRVCNRQGRAVTVVNGRITRESHGRYVYFKRWLPEFNRISLFCVQSAEYARRFGVLGIDPARVCVTGNVKFDGLRTGPVETSEELARFVAPRAGQSVLVAGSTHAPEEAQVARAARHAVPQARLVLVPRHPNRAGEIVEQLAAAGCSVQRLTELRAGRRVDEQLPLLVDTIGELERIYALADLVFVGGSLVPHGGQNMLEPAAQGKAVLFGPHVENFDQEATLLLAAGACRKVADERELEAQFARLLADPLERERMGCAGIAAVAAQRGATQLTLDALRDLGLEALAARDSSG
ncbi:MAG: 3-deoxy-D-manno-octulosonic acid transferase [Planctomycetes bacterium]|nr:3-deoxy-D-manno-octulosonic acid transferase [Planctomycetota bacterium]